jgi:hypothetical protein
MYIHVKIRFQHKFQDVTVKQKKILTKPQINLDRQGPYWIKLNKIKMLSAQRGET